MNLLTGKLTGIPSRKPVGFFPDSAPSPRRGEESGKPRCAIPDSYRKPESRNRKEAGIRFPSHNLAHARAFAPQP